MAYNVYSLPDCRTVLYHPDVGTANLHLYASGNDGYGTVMSRHCGLFSAKIHDFITSGIADHCYLLIL